METIMKITSPIICVIGTVETEYADGRELSEKLSIQCSIKNICTRDSKIIVELEKPVYKDLMNWIGEEAVAGMPMSEGEWVEDYR